jgi:hypothetical protein
MLWYSGKDRCNYNLVVVVVVVVVAAGTRSLRKYIRLELLYCQYKYRIIGLCITRSLLLS